MIVALLNETKMLISNDTINQMIGKFTKELKENNNNQPINKNPKLFLFVFERKKLPRKNFLINKNIKEKEKFQNHHHSPSIINNDNNCIDL